MWLMSKQCGGLVEGWWKVDGRLLFTTFLNFFLFSIIITITVIDTVNDLLQNIKCGGCGGCGGLFSLQQRAKKNFFSKKKLKKNCKQKKHNPPPSTPPHPPHPPLSKSIFMMVNKVQQPYLLYSILFCSARAADIVPWCARTRRLCMEETSYWSRNIQKKRTYIRLEVRTSLKTRNLV